MWCVSGAAEIHLAKVIPINRLTRSTFAIIGFSFEASENGTDWQMVSKLERFDFREFKEHLISDHRT